MMTLHLVKYMFCLIRFIGELCMILTRFPSFRSYWGIMYDLKKSLQIIMFRHHFTIMRCMSLFEHPSIARMSSYIEIWGHSTAIAQAMLG